MNPRAAINDLHPFQGCPFGQLGYFSKCSRINPLYLLYLNKVWSYLQRRGWDSNPCALSDKRFSRPPRYDHFDTSPKYSTSNQCKRYSSKNGILCQHVFSKKFATYQFPSTFYFNQHFPPKNNGLSSSTRQNPPSADQRSEAVLNIFSAIARSSGVVSLIFS